MAEIEEKYTGPSNPGRLNPFGSLGNFQYQPVMQNIGPQDPSLYVTTPTSPNLDVARAGFVTSLTDKKAGIDLSKVPDDFVPPEPKSQTYGTPGHQGDGVARDLNYDSNAHGEPKNNNRDVFNAIKARLDRGRVDLDGLKATAENPALDTTITRGLNSTPDPQYDKLRTGDSLFDNTPITPESLTQYGMDANSYIAGVQDALVRLGHLDKGDIASVSLTDPKTVDAIKKFQDELEAKGVETGTDGVLSNGLMTLLNQANDQKILDNAADRAAAEARQQDLRQDVASIKDMVSQRQTRHGGEHNDVTPEELDSVLDKYGIQDKEFKAVRNGRDGDGNTANDMTMGRQIALTTFLNDPANAQLIDQMQKDLSAKMGVQDVTTETALTNAPTQVETVQSAVEVAGNYR